MDLGPQIKYYLFSLRIPVLMQDDILQIVDSTLRDIPNPTAVLGATTLGKDLRR